MRRLLDSLRDAHNSLLITALLLLCLAGLLYLYPREGNFKYTYTEGQIWLYDDYFAPEETEIYLLDNEYENAKEALKQNAIPVYRRKSDIETAKLAAAKEAVHQAIAYMNPSDFSEWTGFSMKDEGAMEAAETGVLDALHDIFEIGVINLDSRHEEFTSEKQIRVIEGAYAADVEVGDLLTLSSAFERFSNDHRSGPAYIHDAITPMIAYNLVYDEAATLKLIETKINGIPRKSGELKQGQLIIRKGERVGTDEMRELDAIRKNFEADKGSRSWWIILIGQALLIGMALLSIVIITFIVRPEILVQPSRVTFLLILILIMALMVKGALLSENINELLIPLCILPIVLRAFYDSRFALLFHIIVVCMLGFIVPSSFDFVILHSFSGVVLLYGMKSVARRSEFFTASFILLVSYSITFFGLKIVQEGNLNAIHLQDFGWLAGNALLSLLAFPMIYLFERSFGFLSEIRLLEISDPSNQLLRDLNEKAPGTFQHSLQVANLAEEAIREIGGNALLVRVGALYHDIGKMDSMAYFTENQHGVNPHNNLEPIESSRIIVQHVISGIEMARKARLPEEIIDFIRTHHGTSRTEYFYRKALQFDPSIDDKQFRYPGPLPFTRETAVVMMADSVEASSRSLKTFTDESISELINTIVDYQQEMGQFQNSPLTFKDISLIKKVFHRKLMNIYHARIAYPEKIR